MLNEVMRRIKEGETEGVVVAKLDRFGRTLVGSLQLLDEIQKVGGQFASVADDYDISTKNGRMLLNITLSMASSNWSGSATTGSTRATGRRLAAPTSRTRRSAISGPRTGSSIQTRSGAGS